MGRLHCVPLYAHVDNGRESRAVSTTRMAAERPNANYNDMGRDRTSSRISPTRD